jgi:hypothetical protein
MKSKPRRVVRRTRDGLVLEVVEEALSHEVVLKLIDCTESGRSERERGERKRAKEHCGKECILGGCECNGRPAQMKVKV